MGTPTDQTKKACETFIDNPTSEWGGVYESIEDIDDIQKGASYLAYFSTQMHKYIELRKSGEKHDPAIRLAALAGFQWRRLLEGGPTQVAAEYLLGLSKEAAKMFNISVAITPDSVKELSEFCAKHTMISEVNLLAAIMYRAAFLTKLCAFRNEDRMPLEEAMERAHAAAKRASEAIREQPGV